MRFMMVCRPQFPLPPDMLPALVDGFAAWWDRYKDRWESAGFFAGEGGGGGICRVADEAEFHRMMMEWPLTAFSQIDSRALIDMDDALKQWQDMVAAMGLGQPETSAH